VGAFFIKEGGSLRGEASCLEFPFHTADLMSSRHAGGAADPAPAVPPPAAPKPAARAQIVPIATRREVPVPPPAAVPPARETAASPAPAEPPSQRQERAAEPRKAAEPAAPPPAAPEAAKPPQTPPARVEAEEAPKAEAPAAARPESKEKETAAAIESPAAPEAQKSVPAPSRPEPAEKVSVPVSAVESWATEVPSSGPLSGKVAWIAGAAVVVLALVGLFVYPGLLVHHATRPAAPAASASRQDSSPLSLRVERTANELVLTWNRDADPIQKARSARLSIADGERHENYDMNLEELRKGSIVYMPVTPDVSFRMEVMGQGEEKTASELVRVLRTSPMPDEAAKTVAQKPAAPAGQAAAPATDAAAAQPEAPARVAPTPVKPFKMEPLAQRLRPATQGDLPEAPALGDAAPSQPLNLGSVAPAPPVVSAPAPLAAAAAPPEKKAAAAQGGHVQPGQLILRKEPDYPRLARQTGVKGAVEVEATVGADGKVKSVKVLSGHPMLQKAAVDAVMQWVYKPTLLNGKAVESQTRIVLNFVASR
jgi:protein TonB